MRMHCMEGGHTTRRGPASPLRSCRRCRCLPLRRLTQALCRKRALGGKDNRDNLRAKLLRCVRQELGLPVYGPHNVSPGAVRMPQDMSEAELRQLFVSRGCLPPVEPLQALSLANALLVADGLVEPTQVGGAGAALMVVVVVAADEAASEGCR